MGKFSAANLNKTIYYLKRNGLQETWYAARERLAAKDHYSYEALTDEILAWQRSQVAEWQGQAVSWCLFFGQPLIIWKP